MKRILSGIQPTGSPTVGNYIGALKNWVGLQDGGFECYYCVADLHAVTTDVAPVVLRENTVGMFALLAALGIDPVKHALFVQSHVPAHAQLAWLLDCHTQFGEAKRMTQFKDKSAKSPENINVGLFSYPVLMAADILLYQADLVPVGQDQKQHLELTRVIAERFNNKYGKTFTVPDGYIPKSGAKIMSLADPAVKMAKSDANENAYVLISDEPDTVLKKFKRAVTDSDNVIKFKGAGHGVSNLLTVYCEFAGKKIAEAEAEFAGKGYGVFKTAVAEVVIEKLKPVRENLSRLLADRAHLDKLMKAGAEKAAAAAEKTLKAAYGKAGFYL